jgi:alpha-amylase/alpha-mannosidase (GH57 family)
MAPVRFVFGLHLHQPVGNFDHVFQQHLDDVYSPLLDRLTGGEFLPVVLHVSGPLLDWLEAHAPLWMDRLGRLAVDGKVELLLSGFYEPILASLPRRDRLDQIGWMREALRRRFGVEATGLWLTERVWQPELAADLAEAGVKYALVDDRHFVVCGFPQDRLHRPYWTEADGKRIALFPIDERLRYLIPFRPPEETAEYLERLGAEGHQLAVLADDGEKFGGWPGTKDWVYHQGWLDRFIQSVRELAGRGLVRLSTLAESLADVPSGGIAYLPTASYREMEGWSLPPDAAVRLSRLERDLGEARMAGPDGALVRGTHWSNFLAKYPEANRMHKKMQALSELCRARHDPPQARHAIGRAQCNDA